MKDAVNEKPKEVPVSQKLILWHSAVFCQLIKSDIIQYEPIEIFAGQEEVSKPMYKANNDAYDRDQSIKVVLPSVCFVLKPVHFAHQIHQFKVGITKEYQFINVNDWHR